MTRRSKAVPDLDGQVVRIKCLLDTFCEKLDRGGLREQVVSLIPAVHGLRDLGSSLVVGVDIRSAPDRILAYLKKYPATLIDGDELMIVAGIGEWARRVRELRVEQGWAIYTGATLSDAVQADPSVLLELQESLKCDEIQLRPDQYILLNASQDRDAAFRWNQINQIRKQSVGVKAKILTYLQLNVGHPVGGEELRYLAKDNKEWARRVRELRTEDGWPIVTRAQGRSDLSIGEYLLEADEQAEPHDRKIPDDVRVEVLKRDDFGCTFCGWKRRDFDPADPRKNLQLHHLIEHVKGGANESENLRTLCNVHHVLVHAGKLSWVNSKWVL